MLKHVTLSSVYRDSTCLNKHKLKLGHATIKTPLFAFAFVLCVLKKIEEYGAEGGLNSNTLFLPFLLGIFDFLRKTASLAFRIVRTLGTVGTQLYLSCS